MMFSFVSYIKVKQDPAYPHKIKYKKQIEQTETVVIINNLAAYPAIFRTNIFLLAGLAAHHTPNRPCAFRTLLCRPFITQ
jgi:hypothetical protein